MATLHRTMTKADLDTFLTKTFGVESNPFELEVLFDLRKTEVGWSRVESALKLTVADSALLVGALTKADAKGKAPAPAPAAPKAQISAATRNRILPYGANSVILSIDQKALYKANCDRAKGKDMQIMSERARWGVTNKGSGYDTLPYNS